MSRAGSSSPAIELKGVSAGYLVAEGLKSLRRKYVEVLRGVSLRVGRGERLAVIGESGSGKTTLLKVVLGLLRPVKGDVVVLGHRIYDIPERERWKVTSRMGYVPQDPFRALNPRLRVADIVAEPLTRLRLPESEKRERVRAAIKMVQLHESVLEYYPSRLSGGMMQRVLIARAVVHEPELLLLDEPTSALDVSTQAQVINLLNSIQERLGCAMVAVTHDLAVAQYLADRAVVLYRGVVVEEGPLDEIVRSPKSEHARALVASYSLGSPALLGNV
ncbi:MAG: dipeptide/oligopeptide/nickel ABC transporter ATP-binding protein [Thermofilum sp.]|nr:dipeptide/oligopeptide/nickel ABC transporter ATP-binding protein [Thermofilum sp.]MCC6064624.1 dipeptide/oligopeptide/nickel ABC transporter ATP-binding protein [Thermofilum sp.]